MNHIEGRDDINKYLLQRGINEHIVEKMVSNILMYKKLHMLNDKDFVRNEKGDLEEIRNICIKGMKVYPKEEPKDIFREEKPSIKILKNNFYKEGKDNVLAREIMRN